MNPAAPPVGKYLSFKRSGELLYASGRVSDLIGEVDKDVSIDEAKKAARDTVLLILSIIKADLGNLNLIAGVVKMQGFIRCSPTFTRLPEVLDGASELLIQLYGEDGEHARTATGVTQLPFGATIQLDIIFQLKENKV